MRLGPFELHDMLGRGGMAEVWRATHATEGVEVAVKVMTAARAREPHYRRAFGREVRAVAAVNHRGIVAVLDHGEVSAAEALASGRWLPAQSPYLIMERGAGTLVDEPEPTTFEAVQTVLLALLGALAHAHARQVIHRDVKPSNILVFRAPGADPVVKLSDFGLSFALDDSEVEEADLRRVTGSVRYMAPEQILGRWRDQGPWTDLYALGCTAFWLTTGQTPHGGPDVVMQDVLRGHLEAPVPALRPRVAVPDGFEAWVRRLLARSPHQRFLCAADAARSLAALGPGPRRRARPTGSVRMSRPIPGVGLGLFGLRAVPMVGREAERAAAEQLLDEVVATRRSRMLVVTGEAGVGKSRLAGWLSERAHEHGVANTLRASHGPTQGPSAGLRGLVSHALRTAGLPRAAVQERIAKLLRRRGVVEPIWAQGLTELAHEHTADGEPSTFRFQNEAERHRVVFVMLRVLCAERPLIVWLDDVQWGAEGLRFARFVLDAQATSPLPVLLVATARDEGLADEEEASELLAELEARVDVQVLALGPLSAPHQQQLVHTLLGLEPRVAQQVIERTEGNPLFAVQLVGDWVQRGVLVPGAEGFALPPNARLAVPADILALWDQRIERLLTGAPSGWGAALELAATLGQEVDAEEWRQACIAVGVPDDDALVDAATEARLVIPDHGSWSFAHGMLRECIERRAVDGHRAADHHRVCAAALARIALRAPARGLAERIGQHWMHARAFAEALAPLLTAVEERYDGGDFEGAFALLKRWTTCMQRLQRSPGDPSWIDGWLLLARVQRRRGAYDVAQRVLERCRTLPDTDPCRQGRLRLEYAQVLSAIAHIRQQPLLYTEALGLHGEAMRLFEEGLDVHGVASAVHSQAVTRGMTGDLDAARRDFLDALARFERLEARLPHAIAMAGLANVEHRAGDLARAVELGTRAVVVLEQLSAGYHVAQALYGLAEVDREQGRFEAAAQGYQRVLDLLQVTASFNGHLARSSRAHCLMELDRFAEAHEHLATVLDALALEGPPAFRVELRAGLLWAEAALGRLDAMDAQLAALVVAPEAALSPLAARYVRGAVAALEDAGEHDRAARVEALAPTPHPAA